uniref:Uncharacterized protein n=1 Tax=Salix viminalis TaxID=40686 RepID=A0A6N2MSG2_SALVM
MIKALVGLLPVCSIYSLASLNQSIKTVASSNLSLLPGLGFLFPLHFLAWKGETFSAGRSLFGIERW